MKMKVMMVAAAVLALGLSGCNGDVRATKLTPELLENQQAVMKISGRLTPPDRAMFAKYLLSRRMATSGLEGALLTPEGKDPATVAQAIEAATKMQALVDERDAKAAVFDVKLAQLEGPMKASNYAPGPTQAYNDVLDQKNAMIGAYNARFQAGK